MSRSDSGSRRRAAALAEVDEYIAGISGVGRLPPGKMRQYSDRRYNVGWLVSSVFSDGIRRKLHVIADSDFPYTPPRVALADGPGILAWPHLEEGGLLCVLPPETAVSSQSPATVVAYVLGEACAVIEANISASNEEDFRREFLSYWALAASKGAPVFLSALDPECESQQVAVWRGEQVRVVGESPEALRRWLPRWGAKPGTGGQYKLSNGVLIWLPKPLTPAEYPDTPAEVRALVRQHSPEVTNVLEGLAIRCVDEIDVVLGARTAHGACFGALVLKRPRQPPGSKGKGAPMLRGFRPGHVPPALLVKRHFSGAVKATKAIVKRADHLWIHGRDQDRRQSYLRAARGGRVGLRVIGRISRSALGAGWRRQPASD